MDALPQDPPLSHLRILELGSFIAGPFAGQLLGDLGAEVIKIEPPNEGDPMRKWGILQNDESLWWPSIARNKRSVVIDLRREEGRQIIRLLAREVDVILENFRPGTLEKWGLSYQELSAENPKLIVTHVSGFGQTGPMAAQPGFGSIGEAMGGIRHTTGSPDRPAARTGISLGDSLAAIFAVVGTLAAVVERDRSGHGQEVDVAIYEAVAALMETTMADYELAGVTRTRSGSVLPGVAPSNVYPSADGADLIIAANADAVFTRLAKAMDQPELACDPRFVDHHARGANSEELDIIISQWTSLIPAEDVLAILNEHAVPVGRSFTAPDMLNDPHYAAREMVLRLTSARGVEIPTAGIVPKLSRTPGQIKRSGPALGEDTYTVLQDLAKLEAAELETLITSGVIATST